LCENWQGRIEIRSAACLLKGWAGKKNTRGGPGARAPDPARARLLRSGRKGDGGGGREERDAHALPFSKGNTWRHDGFEAGPGRVGGGGGGRRVGGWERVWARARARADGCRRLKAHPSTRTRPRPRPPLPPNTHAHTPTHTPVHGHHIKKNKAAAKGKTSLRKT